MRFWSGLAILAALFAAPASPASAKDGIDAWAEIGGRAVHSDRTVTEGDEVESSGIGASIDSGFEWKSGRTQVQFDLGASVFDYSDETRDTRESATASLSVIQGLNETVHVGVAAGHAEDIATLEAYTVDQDAIRAEVQYEDKVHRIRLRAQYREREYDVATPSKGKGMRYDAQYNHRFAAWHWARLEARAEDIDSADPRRGYERYMVRAAYSHPLDADKMWRLRPQIEYWNWTYDGRRVLDADDGALRHDSNFQPEIGLAYGKTNGLQGHARAAYQFRNSNDPRYDKSAPYLELSLGYRF